MLVSIAVAFEAPMVRNAVGMSAPNACLPLGHGSDPGPAGSQPDVAGEHLRDYVPSLLCSSV